MYLNTWDFICEHLQNMTPSRAVFNKFGVSFPDHTCVLQMKTPPSLRVYISLTPYCIVWISQAFIVVLLSVRYWSIR